MRHSLGDAVYFRSCDYLSEKFRCFALEAADRVGSGGAFAWLNLVYIINDVCPLALLLLHRLPPQSQHLNVIADECFDAVGILAPSFPLRLTVAGETPVSAATCSAVEAGSF